MSDADYDIYEVEEGVMMMQDKKTQHNYYFPATMSINPDEIRKRPVTHVEDIDEMLESLD